MEKVIDQDTPEFRLGRNDVLFRMLDYMDVNTELPSVESRLDYFCSLGEEGFVEMVTGLNRILTKSHGKENYLAQEHNFISNPENPSDFQAMPAKEDKVDLLKELYRIGEYLASDRQAPVGHVAAVLGFGINAIHPFLGGNGRTARTLYTLLTTPKAKTDRLDVINLDSGGDLVHLNPSIFRDTVYRALQLSIGSHYEAGGEVKALVLPAMLGRAKDLTTINPANRKQDAQQGSMLNATCMDKNLSGMVPFQFLQTTRSSIVERVLTKVGDQSIFLLDRFAEEATEADMAEYYYSYRQITATYVYALIDLISDIRAKNESILVPLRSGITAELPIVDFVTRIPKGELDIVR